MLLTARIMKYPVLVSTLLHKPATNFSPTVNSLKGIKSYI